MFPRSLVPSVNVDTQEIPTWLQNLLKADGRWDLTKLEDLLTDFRSLSLIELTASEPGRFRLSLPPWVSEWIKCRADLATRRQCLFEATRIVNMCLEGKALNVTRFNLSVEAEHQTLQHQSSCVEHIRQSRHEDRGLTEYAAFAKYWAIFEAAASTVYNAQEGTLRFEEAAQEGEGIDESISELERDAPTHGQETIGWQSTQALLNWLSEDDNGSRLLDLTSRSDNQILQWLLDRLEFQAWSRTECQTLWIHGRGKSLKADWAFS